MAGVERLLTIGVYGKSAEAFFGALHDTSVDTFCDIRQRRGVRGSQYSFVNSTRLQAELANRGIAYLYVPELAPSRKIRDLQHEADAASAETKRTREELGETFKRHYIKEVLDRFDAERFRDSLGSARRVAFFCVEGKPSACHRSLVAARLGGEWNLSVEHL
jgi:uncharacterized protein (DUF488 family)